MEGYVIDPDTGKMELSFSKQAFVNLPTDLKNDIKRYFLFSPSRSLWISKGSGHGAMPTDIAKRLISRPESIITSPAASQTIDTRCYFGKRAEEGAKKEG